MWHGKQQCLSIIGHNEWANDCPPRPIVSVASAHALSGSLCKRIVLKRPPAIFNEVYVLESFQTAEVASKASYILKVIVFGTIRQTTYDFLLVFGCKYVYLEQFPIYHHSSLIAQKLCIGHVVLSTISDDLNAGADPYGGVQ